MGNALSQNLSTPPAPNPQPQQQQNPTPQGNALAMNGAGPMGQSPEMGPQQTAPAPNHQQTVAALRHFNAIETELTDLLNDPSVGRSDLKSKIIDGTTKLVANRILTPAQAVTQLGDVPERPFDQKTWLEQHLQQVSQAATLVLAHHQVGYAGQDVDTTPPDEEDHLGTVAGLQAQYKGRQQ